MKSAATFRAPALRTSALRTSALRTSALRTSALGAAALAAMFGQAALAQSFVIESAVLDSRSAQSLGVSTERGAMADFFRAQKAMTFGIMRAAGIALDQLPADVRARIERFQTTNLDAFRAYSQGLDLKDQGRFAEAKEFFRRAADLDPGFGLAVEQQQAMPQVNVGSGVQLRAVIAAASSTAVDRGKQGFTVDLAAATAALQAGQTVVVTTAPVEQAQAASKSGDFSSNPPGASGQFAPHQVAGLSFGYKDSSGSEQNLSIVNEYPGSKYVANAGVLDGVGAAGDFQAQRIGATVGATGAPNASLLLADGVTTAYWGTWLSKPGTASSASVTVSGAALTAPTLGNVDYVLAEATRQMPSSGVAEFRPAVSAGGVAMGTFSAASGSIKLDFALRTVELKDLGFSVNGLAFSGLRGSALYDPNVASGAFQGKYSAGACPTCASFAPGSSIFGGNFVGRNADGLIFSTILLTGSGTASGVHLFTH